MIYFQNLSLQDVEPEEFGSAHVSITRVAERLVVDTVSCYVVGYTEGMPALCCLLPKVDLLTKQP